MIELIGRLHKHIGNGLAILNICRISACPAHNYNPKNLIHILVLDTKLTPELIEEGFIREIISKIQTMRKEADFDALKICCWVASSMFLRYSVFTL